VFEGGSATVMGYSILDDSPPLTPPTRIRSQSLQIPEAADQLNYFNFETPPWPGAVSGPGLELSPSLKRKLSLPVPHMSNPANSIMIDTPQSPEPHLFSSVRIW